MRLIRFEVSKFNLVSIGFIKLCITHDDDSNEYHTKQEQGKSSQMGLMYDTEFKRKKRILGVGMW